MRSDYYKVLAVDRDADDLTLKCAYYKLAVQHHPERNQGSTEAEEKFKEAAEAYRVLSDPNQRSAYDAAAGITPLSPQIAGLAGAGRSWRLQPLRLIPYGVAIATAFVIMVSMSGLGRFLASTTSRGRELVLPAASGALPGSVDQPMPRPNSAGRRASKSIGTVAVARGAMPIAGAPLVYPPNALREGVSGQVELQITIAEDGSIQNPHVLSGHPQLVQGLTEGIGHWTFRSMRVNGRPVPLTTEMTLRFDITH
jgi:TonB family protein